MEYNTLYRSVKGGLNMKKRILLITLIPLIFFLLFPFAQDKLDFVLESSHFIIILLVFCEIYKKTKQFNFIKYALFALLLNLYIDILDEFITANYIEDVFDSLENYSGIFAVVLLTINFNKIKRFYEKVYQNIEKDTLTGLLNMRHLDQFLLTKEKFTIIFIDLDNIREINDKFGREKGNEILITFAKILKDVFDEEVFKYRLSGDEYLLLYFGDRYEEAIEDNNILINLAQKEHIEYSYGIGTSEDGETVSELITRCDRLMYTMKFRKKYEKD